MITQYPIITTKLVGSRLFGVSGFTSDYDYKRVVLPPIQDLLLGKDVHRAKECEDRILEGYINSNNKIELTYMTLHKFLELACDGQSVAYEMLWNEKKTWIPFDKPFSYVWDDIVKNRKDFITKKTTKFLGFARAITKKYYEKATKYKLLLELQKYFMDMSPDTKIEEYLDFLFKVADDETLKINEEAKQVIVKTSTLQYNNSVQFMKDALTKHLKGYGSRVINAQEGDYKSMYHAFRCIYQAEELFTTGGLIFPLKDADFLWKVKNGKIDFQYLMEKLEKEFETVNNIITKSNLPEEPKLDWDEFIIDVYKNYMFR